MSPNRINLLNFLVLALSILWSIPINPIIKTKQTNRCPHPNFAIKHLFITKMENLEDITRFEEQIQIFQGRRSHFVTTISSVFVARKMGYVEIQGICKFTEPALKFNCFLRTKRKIWYYIKKGQVIASHLRNIGLYEPSADLLVLSASESVEPQ